MWFSGTLIWSFHDGDIGIQLRALTRNSVLDGIRRVKMPCMADLCQSKSHFFSDLLYDLNPTKTPHHPEIPNWQQHMGFYNLQTEKRHKWHKKTSTLTKSHSRRCGGENLVALPDRPVRMARVDSGSFLLKSPKATRPALYEVISMLKKDNSHDILPHEIETHLSSAESDQLWSEYLNGFPFDVAVRKWTLRCGGLSQKFWGPNIKLDWTTIFNNSLLTNKTDKGETKSELLTLQQVQLSRMFCMTLHCMTDADENRTIARGILFCVRITYLAVKNEYILSVWAPQIAGIVQLDMMPCLIFIILRWNLKREA